MIKHKGNGLSLPKMPFFEGTGANKKTAHTLAVFLFILIVRFNNMKIPCAMTAREIAGTTAGTSENEIISTLSIATSSLVTILVLGLGVLLLAPLQPVLQSPALQPAFENVVPALFGAMAYRYYRKNIKLSLVPLIIMSLLFIFVLSLISQTSIMILPAGAVTIGLAWLLFRKYGTIESKKIKEIRSKASVEEKE